MEPSKDGNTRRVQGETHKLRERIQVWSNKKRKVKGRTSTDKEDRASYFGTRSA